MPERRFRDMSLTEEEAAAHVFEHWEHGDDAGIARLARVQTRARRLLPLWRKWGLEELYIAAEELQHLKRVTPPLTALTAQILAAVNDRKSPCRSLKDDPSTDEQIVLCRQYTCGRLVTFEIYTELPK